MQLSHILRSRKRRICGHPLYDAPFGGLNFAKALCDLEANINLMPLDVFRKLDLEAPKLTTMRLLMEDHSVKRPVGIFYDALVKLETFMES